MGTSMGLRDMRWSAMLKRRGQGVEVYLLGEGGLGWFKRVSRRPWMILTLSERQSAVTRDV